MSIDLTEPQLIRTRDVIEARGDPPWSERLLEDGRNTVELTCSAPGEAGRSHVHPDHNEWWIVVTGQYVSEIGDHGPTIAQTGDIVFCPAGVPHSATATGDNPAARLTVAKLDGLQAEGGPDGRSAPPAYPTEPPNMLHTRLTEIVAGSGEPPWKHTLVADDRNAAFLICQAPGMANRAHWHYDFDEWWMVLGGELTWEIGSRPAIHAAEGDIVYSPRGFRHSIKTVGTRPSLRLPVTPPDNPHVWTDEDVAAPPPRQ